MNFPPTVLFQPLSNISFNKSLPPFLLSDQPFMKSSTIYFSLKALSHLIFLLRLMIPHHISVTSPKPRQMVISEDYASTRCSILTRTQIHLLACLRQCLVEDCWLARVLPIPLLNRRRSFKKLYSLDLLSPPFSVRRVSRYLWAWVRQEQA